MANETNTDVVQLNTSIEAAQWVADRDKLLAESQGVTQVTNDAELEKAGSIEARGKKLIKKLETARKEVTSPIDELKKKIMAREKELRANIETEVTRINKMTTAYATEQARKAEEERRRIEQMERGVPRRNLPPSKPPPLIRLASMRLLLSRLHLRPFRCRRCRSCILLPTGLWRCGTSKSLTKRRFRASCFLPTRRRSAPS